MKLPSGGIKTAAHESGIEIDIETTFDKVADSLDNLGRSLEYLIIAGVHTKSAVGALRFLPQISALLSGTAFAMKIIRLNTGEEESEMMTTIKKSFLNVNEKLDVITSDLKNNRNLIKLRTQRAVYISAENKILSAHENVRRYFKKLTDLKCSNKLDCDAKQLLISQSYASRFNVKKEVDMILKGSISGGLFGDPLLNLTKEASKCDIKKIKITASTITGLATKGQIAAMLYESITDPSFDMVSFETDFAQQLLTLEKIKESLSKQCYDNIDKYIRSDVKYLSVKYYKQYANDVQIANKLLSEYIQRKYFWIPFYVISITAGRICMRTKRRFWASDALTSDIAYTYKDKYKQILSYVLIRPSPNKNYGNTQRRYFFHENYKDHIQSLSSALLYVSPCYKGVVSYAGKAGPIHTRDLSRISFNVDGIVNMFGYLKFVYPWPVGAQKPPMRVVALHAPNVKACSLECSSHGSCHFLIHTTIMYCFCNKNFYGAHCESSIETQKMSNDLNKLLNVNKLHMPSNSDLKAELQKTENIFRSNFQTSMEKSKTLSKRLSKITTDMVSEINKNKQWQNLVDQYADVIQDLQYYYQVMLEYDTLDINIESDPFLKQEKFSFAKMIVNPDKLRKHLQMVNYLFTGRHDTPLVNHRSLILEEMENNKKYVCSERYKSALGHAYGSLSSLQLQGYSTYIRALHVLELDTSTLVGEYKAKLLRQKTYLDDATCSIVIPNSKGLENCQGGYYVYSGMMIDVACKDTFYLEGLYFLYIDILVKLSN